MFSSSYFFFSIPFSSLFFLLFIETFPPSAVELLFPNACGDDGGGQKTKG
jgi:hypothetical protein